MRYLKLFENFQSEDEIRKICDQHNIIIKSIDLETGLINVNSCNLTYRLLKVLPLNFGHVDYDFDLSYNKLTNLKKAPISVGRDFWCNQNQLTSLEGAPKSVGRTFNCGDNKLTNLVGAPTSVGYDFNASFNNLTSLEGAPKEIKGKLYIYQNPNLYSLTGLSDQHRFEGLDVDDTPFEEIYKLLNKWSPIATYEYFYWDFLFEKDGVWCCDLDNLNSFLMVMTDEYKIPYQEVTELKNYKCI